MTKAVSSRSLAVSQLSGLEKRSCLQKAVPYLENSMCPQYMRTSNLGRVQISVSCGQRLPFSRAIDLESSLPLNKDADYILLVTGP